MTSVDLAIIVGTALSALALIITVWITWKVHKNQKLLAQRQLLLPLWEYMSKLREINPAEPIAPDVINLVNTLELVALCCEGGLIDEKIILRTFRESFIKHYTEIDRCNTINGLNKTGKQLLMENRAASKFYSRLMHDHISQDQISSRP
jgi:hypothetical protein